MRRTHLVLVVLGAIGIFGLTMAQLGAQSTPRVEGPLLLPSTFTGPKEGVLEGRDELKLPPVPTESAPKLPEIPMVPAKELQLPPTPMVPEVGNPAPFVPMVPSSPLPMQPKNLEPTPSSLTLPSLPVPKPVPSSPNGSHGPSVPTGPSGTEVPMKLVPPTASPKLENPTPIPMAKPLEFPAIKPVEESKIKDLGPTPTRINPSVTLDVIAPESVPSGKDVSYELVVRNTGTVAVGAVRLEDDLPQGTRFVGAEPTPDVNLTTLRWNIGTLEPGAEKRVKVTVRPAGEGDFKSYPRVVISGSTTNHVKLTRPRLAVVLDSPDSILIGSVLTAKLVIRNDGTGVANKLKVHVSLTPGLNHPSQRDGSPVEAEFPPLAPGETRSVELRLTATQPGQQICQVTVMADQAGAVTHKANVMVQEPKLELRVSNPGRAIVRGEPVVTLELSNPGNARALGVQAAVAFPEGIEFVSASESGNYEPGTRTVTWNIGAIDANGKKNVTVKVRPGVAGNLAVRAIAQNDKLQAKAESVLVVDGVPAVSFEVVNVDNPAEVGKEVTYEIRVRNQGTCALTQVRLAALFSEGLNVTDVKSPIPHKISGQSLFFEPAGKLAVNADIVIKVKAKGTVAGDLRCRVSLSCDQLKQPVTKEESTVFYSN